MDIIEFTKIWDFSDCTLLLILNLIVSFLYLWAFLRTKKGFFLILAVSSMGCAFSNGFFATELIYSLNKTRLFAPSTMRTLQYIHFFMSAVMPFVWIYGIFALVRFAVNKEADKIPS
jgi:hypothetical protein